MPILPSSPCEQSEHRQHNRSLAVSHGLAHRSHVTHCLSLAVQHHVLNYLPVTHCLSLLASSAVPVNAVHPQTHPRLLADSPFLLNRSLYCCCLAFLPLTLVQWGLAGCEMCVCHNNTSTQLAAPAPTCKEYSLPQQPPTTTGPLLRAQIISSIQSQPVPASIEHDWTAAFQTHNWKDFAALVNCVMVGDNC